MTDPEQWRDRLADATWLSSDEIGALLPVVAGIIAAELRAAAARHDEDNPGQVSAEAQADRARADQLAPPT